MSISKDNGSADYLNVPQDNYTELELERIEDIKRPRKEIRTPNDALRFYSALTHFIGMGFSIAGLVLLIVFACQVGTVWHVVAFSVYGASLVSLYAASAFYHSLPLSPRGRLVLRKLDHSMIYFLIAGTYTPICLVPLNGAWGWSLFGVIWGFAVLGIVLKIFFIHAPRWLSAVSYVGMGWLAVLAIYPLTQTMPAGGLAWLFLGGFFYTLGSVMYAFKFPGRNCKLFGFHEWFHIFCLLGSLCHFIMMVRYVLYIQA